MHPKNSTKRVLPQIEYFVSSTYFNNYPTIIGASSPNRPLAPLPFARTNSPTRKGDKCNPSIPNGSWCLGQSAPPAWFCPVCTLASTEGARSCNTSCSKVQLSCQASGTYFTRTHTSLPGETLPRRKVSQMTTFPSNLAAPQPTSMCLPTCVVHKQISKPGVEADG